MENGELRIESDEKLYTLNELKVAVINKDIKKLSQIVDRTPKISSIEEAKEINSFLLQAIKLLQKEKNILKLEMDKIKQLQKFNNQQINSSFNFKG